MSAQGTPAVPMAITRAEHAALCRMDFGFFNEWAFREMHPGQPYEEGSHQRLLCSKLEDVYRGTTRRLCINAMPRGGKSKTTSVAFVAWALGNDPRLKFMCISYGADLSESLASDCLTLMQSAGYQFMFPHVKFKRDRVADFETTAGGGRLSSGVEGPYFGRGADIIIVDDPTKPEEALSDGRRTEVNRTITTKLFTRLNNPTKGRIVIIQQRQHIEDLTGYVRQQIGWDHLVLPAIATRNEFVRFNTCFGPDQHVRAVGELLQPQRMPLEWLMEQKRLIGSIAFQAQYQQDPVPPGGNIVKTQWIHSYHPGAQPPQFDYLIQTWDTANTVGVSSAYSVCLTLGVHQGKLYLLDCLREQLEFPALQTAIKVQYERWPQRPRHVLIEDKASGTQLLQMAKSFGIPAEGIKPKVAKDVRLQMASPLIESGTILFPTHTPWIEDFLVELTRFPQTRCADQVDALSQVLEWYQQKLLAPSIFHCDWGHDEPGVPSGESLLYWLRRH